MEIDKERVKELLLELITAGGLKDRIRLVAALNELLRPILMGLTDEQP